MILYGVDFIQRQMMMVAGTPPSLHYFALYSPKHLKNCSKSMVDKPQEYMTTTGKVTTNSTEGFHG